MKEITSVALRLYRLDSVKPKSPFSLLFKSRNNCMYLRFISIANTLPVISQIMYFDEYDLRIVSTTLLEIHYLVHSCFSTEK